MENENSMLMQMCTENVYNNNIFHVLGLPIDATPKKIRRRREDIEAANTLGGDSWKNEFKYLLGGRATPTFEEVISAFERLEDPEFRLLSEFFWVWPTSDSDSAVEEIITGDRSRAIKTWETDAVGIGEKRLIAQHNLAVIYQFYAIDAEQQLLDQLKINATLLDDREGSEFKSKLCEYWERSFTYWEEIVDNDEFWDRFVERLKATNDPRLTTGLARRIREEFPVAFDNINAGLAVAYARINKFEEAKRHVDYMIKTMKGLDNVDESFKIIFEPMERRVALLIARYDEKAKEDGKSAKDCVDKLLSETEEIRRVALALLRNGQRLRVKLFTDIVSACNRYQVIYGNATQDWKVCSEILEKLKAMDKTEDLRRLIDENTKVIQQNIKEDEESHTCWCCKKQMPACTTFSVPMYGNVYADATRWEVQSAQTVFLSLRFGGGRGYGYQSPEMILRRECPHLGCTRFETIQIKVPCCPECKSNLTWGKVKNYPPIAKLVQQGFKLGKKPDDYDAMEAWGLAAYMNNISRHYALDNEKADGSRELVYSGGGGSSGNSTGCLVPILIVIGAVLAGCAAVLH